MCFVVLPSHFFFGAFLLRWEGHAHRFSLEHHLQGSRCFRGTIPPELPFEGSTPILVRGISRKKRNFEAKYTIGKVAGPDLSMLIPADPGVFPGAEKD